MPIPSPPEVHEDPGLAPEFVAPAASLGAPPAPGIGSEFVAVEGGNGTEGGAGTALGLAYLVMWALLFGFVALSYRSQRRIESRIADLERMIRERTPEE